MKKTQNAPNVKESLGRKDPVEVRSNINVRYVLSGFKLTELER